MNPVTFNDGIARALALYPHQPRVAPLKGWEQSPLFDYVTTYEREKDLLKGAEVTPLEHVALPFEMLRLAVTETAVPWADGKYELGHGTYRTNTVAARHDGELTLVVELKELWDRPQVREEDRLPLPVYLLITNLRHDPEGMADGAYFYYTAVCYRWQWLRLDQPRADAGIDQLVGGALGSFGAFAFDASLPTTHLAMVRPNKQGKSVQWVRSRSHYTLISHGNPANRRTVGERERVTVDREEELKRLAHDRRAHWRTYRHERYRYARGSTRWIKQAWVGPKEWMDGGGKQIYKILEPLEHGTHNIYTGAGHS